MGGYVAAEARLGEGDGEVVLPAAGTEVGLAMDARAKLAALNINARVVSMPCTNRFDRQSTEYRQSVLPPGLPVLAIEASKTDLWWKYFTGRGDVLGVDSFGESAPAKDLWIKFGFTVDNVVAKVEALLQ